MEGGNTVFYLVVFVIIAHFVVGFYFLVTKLSGPVAKEEGGRTENNDPDDQSTTH